MAPRSLISIRCANVSQLVHPLHPPLLGMLHNLNSEAFGSGGAIRLGDYKLAHRGAQSVRGRGLHLRAARAPGTPSYTTAEELLMVAGEFYPLSGDEREKSPPRRMIFSSRIRTKSK